MNEADEQPAKRRWVRRLALGLAVLIGLIVALPIVIIGWLPVWLPPSSVQERLERTLEETFKVEVKIARLDYHPRWGLSIDGLVIGPPEGFEREVLAVDRIELRYELGGIFDRTIVLSTFAIVSPKIVVETKGGVRNLDALLAAMGPSEPEPPNEPSPPPDRSGPLSAGWTVDVRDARIDDLSLEMVGEGPNVAAGDLDLALRARIDPKRLDATLALGLAAGSKPTNLAVRLPDRAIDGRLDVSASATIAADASLGLTLERSGLALRIAAQDLAIGGTPEPPPVDLSLAFAAGVDPGADRASVGELSLDVGGARVATIHAGVDGVVALLDQALGASGAATALIGWRRSERPGIASLEVPAIELDLDHLAPWIRPFAPKMSLGGTIALRDVRAAGTLPELMASAPDVLRAELALERLTADLPAQGAKAGPIAGSLVLAREEGGARRFVLGGGIGAEKIRSGPHAVEKIDLAIAAGVERATYPDLGATGATLTVDLAGVRSPAARIQRAKIGARVTGENPFAPARAGLPPIAVAARVVADRVQAASGTSAISLEGLALTLGAALDRLLEPAERPIAAKIDLRAKRIDTAAAGVAGLELALAAVAPDPRLGTPLDVTASLDAKVQRVKTKEAELAGTRMKLAAKASGIDLNAPPNAALAARLPASASLDLDLALPEIHADLPSTGPIDASAGLSAKVSAAPRAGTISIQGVKLTLAEILVLHLAGDVKKLWAKERWIDLALKLDPLDLGKAKIPSGLLASVPGFSATGKLGFDVRAKGSIVDADRLLAELDRPPLEVQAKLVAEELSAEVPSNQIALEGLDGSIDVLLKAGRTGLAADLRLERLELAGKDPLAVGGAALTFEAGVRDRVWQIASSATVESIGPPGSSQPLAGTRFDLDLVYPIFKSVDLRRFDLKLPDAGLSVALSGRLERRRFGVLRPDLALEVRIDADKLKRSPFGAGAKQLSGKAGLKLAVLSPDERTLVLKGAMEVDRMGVSQPDLQLVNATGRVPFEQRLALPPIAAWAEDRERPKGDQLDALGELQVRMRELAGAIQERAQLYVDPIDVSHESPRTADYEALRPYYAAAGEGAGLTVEKIVTGKDEIRSLSVDLSYQNGLVRFDRFALRIWEGDIYGESAYQIAGEDHLRLRIRATFTDLNLDVPASAALGVPRSSDRELYLVTGNADLRLDLKERSINGYFDLTKMGEAMMVRLIDVMDPAGKDKALQETKGSLGMAQTFGDATGTRLAGAVVVIKQNLLNLDFVWQRRFVNFKKWWWLPVQPIGQALIGPLVVNAARPIRRYSLSAYLENPAIARLNDSVFASLRGRIIQPEPDPEVAQP